MNTTQYKELKGINKTKRNLRDSMGKLELAITNLAEVTANEIHNTNNSFGLEELKDDVQEAGKITGKARKEIEDKIGKKVVESANYKELTKKDVKKLIKEKEKQKGILMQDLIYGIWKNDKAKRKAIWEDVMKETFYLMTKKRSRY